MELFGIYQRTLFRNEETGVTIFSLYVSEKVKERSGFGTVVCFATIPPYSEKTPLCIQGNWEDTENYGKRFHATDVRAETWDVASAAAFVEANCQGIGYAKARFLVNCIGPNIFQKLLSKGSEDQVIHCGIGESQARSLCESVRQTIAKKDLFDYVLHYGGFYSTVSRLYTEYGTKAQDVLRETPYAGLKNGLSFTQCEQIAKDNGHDAFSLERFCAAAELTMRRCANAGNVYLPVDGVLALSKRTLENSKVYPQKDYPVTTLMASIYENDNFIVEEGLTDIVYLKSLYYAEKNTAYHIHRLLQSKKELPFQDGIVKEVEAEAGITYAPQQAESFQLLRHSGVAIVTGGPGTGKTTCINGIIKAYQKLCPEGKIRLCAPTGRAAQRMTESTGMESVTIHRLLEYRPYGNQIMHKDESNPIDADMIVIDEVSMLDIELASIFFSAVRSGSLVLLVGDINQLPSVGPGNVLHDLIDAELPTVRLSVVYRQAGTSPIILNANLVNDGESELVLKEDEFEIEYADMSEDIPDKVVAAVQKTFQKEDPFATQVLCPTKVGDAGTIRLNTLLQNILNPLQEGEDRLIYGKSEYRIGDKIIMKSNNYETGYYNGDVGTVKSISQGSMSVQLLDKVIVLNRDLMRDVELAYAMSIHRSQGSEYRNVIISLPYYPTSMLQRNLIYTAITRAKSKVAIISEDGALCKAIENCDCSKRNTRLCERLKSYQGRKE